MINTRSKEGDLPPPSDILAVEPLKPLAFSLTALTCEFAAYSTPLTTSDMEPEPLDLKTLTATTLAFLATPKCLEPIVPAQCVPCPLPSISSSPCGMVLPQVARPSKSS
ncbi:hypothetical protein WICMUC_000863 [Wickerhamomyces mucosus]|uniref:Uncharacterized protein n=1 Tax=Wickerhamomyces mucosus TaxID=1378264 RepID=A0A9P8PWI0_9ASCO|nr:hypothetical protein WICMUC_000863 [Wickerhamomyces mucosus]